MFIHPQPGAHDLLTVDACAQAIIVRFVQNPAKPAHACLEEEVKPMFTRSGDN
jgi:hypothetical protein